MQSSDLLLLRRKELIAVTTIVAWLVAVFLTEAAFPVAWLLTAAWVALDSYCRRGRYIGWLLFSLLTGPLGFGLYIFARKPGPMICSRCGATKRESNSPCGACGYVTIFGRISNGLLLLYRGLHHSLVKSPAGEAKETAKHASFALAAVTLMGLLFMNAPLLGCVRIPIAIVWSLSAGACWVLVAWWVYLDAGWRKMDGVPWAVLALLTNVVGLVTYLVIRYPDPRSCPSCDASIPTGQKFCPFCGSEAEPMCPHCQAPIMPDWLYCPVCAACLAPVEGRGGDSKPRGDVATAGLTISGSVLDAASGMPIAGARVSVDSLSAGASAVTDSLGRFVLEGMEHRPYVLVASAEGYLSQAKACLPAESARNLSFTLNFG